MRERPIWPRERQTALTRKMKMVTDRLPTQDGRELLLMMLGSIGLRDTARRLGREVRTVTHWRDGTVPVPNAVRCWLMTAACNTSGNNDLLLCRWHYPRANPKLSATKRAQIKERQRALVESILLAVAEADTEPDPLTPYD